MRKIKAFSAVLAVVLAVSMLMSLVASAATKTVYEKIGDTAKSQEWYAVVPEGIDADYGAKEDTLADGETKGTVIYMDLKANEEDDVALFVYEDIAGLTAGKDYILSFKAKASVAEAWLGVAVADVATMGSYGEDEFEAAEADKWFDVSVEFTAEKNTADVIIGMEDVAEFAFYGFDIVEDKRSKDVLEGAAMPENAQISHGDNWSRPDVDDKWSGISPTMWGPQKREIITVDIGGVDTKVLSCVSADGAQYDNSYGKFDLEPNTKYVAVVKVKLAATSTAMNGGWIGLSASTAATSRANTTIFNADGKWHDYAHVFTTGADASDIILTVGPTHTDQKYVTGLDMQIASCEIFKVETDKYDVLGGAGATAAISRNEWNWTASLVKAWDAQVQSDKNVTRTATGYGAEIVGGKLAVGARFTSVAAENEVNAVLGRFGAFDLKANTEYKISFIADIVDPAVAATNDSGYREVKIGDDLIGTLRADDADGLKAYSYTYTTGDAATGLYISFAHPANNWQENGYELKVYDLKIVPTTLPEEEPEDPDVLKGAAMPENAGIVHGDNWGRPAGVVGKWSGISPEMWGPQKREIITVDIGGVDTKVLSCVSASTTAASQYDNSFGTFDLEPNTKYVAIVKAKLAAGVSSSNGAVVGISVNNNTRTDMTRMIADGEWHEYNYTFTTGDDATGMLLYVGPHNTDQKYIIGLDMQIASAIIVKAPEVNVNEKDVLEGAAMPGKAATYIADVWSRPDKDLTWTGTSATQAYGPLYRETKLVDGKWILSFENAKANNGIAPFENSFGKFDLEANTEYVARVTVRSNKGNKSGSDGTYKAAIYVGTSKADALASVEMKDNTEWNTYELKFTTGADAADLLLGVGDNLNTPNDYWTVGGRVLEISACEIFKEADYEDVKREEELAKATEPTFGNMSPDYFASVEEIPGPPATGAVVVPVVAAALAVASGVVVFKKRK